MTWAAPLGAAPEEFAGIGELIRRYRTAAGLTQEELSEKADISVRAVRNLEHGLARRPRRSTLQLLAGALGLDGDTAARLVDLARRSGASSPPRELSAVIVITQPPGWICRLTLFGWPGCSAAAVRVVLAMAGQAGAGAVGLPLPGRPRRAAVPGSNCYRAGGRSVRTASRYGMGRRLRSPTRRIPDDLTPGVPRQR
jgi:transcriptional regulator with XRE-family HTH domain